MSPSQENWSPSEGNFKPLDKAFSTILHGRLVQGSYAWLGTTFPRQYYIMSGNSMTFSSKTYEQMFSDKPFVFMLVNRKCLPFVAQKIGLKNTLVWSTVERKQGRKIGTLEGGGREIGNSKLRKDRRFGLWIMDGRKIKNITSILRKKDTRAPYEWYILSVIVWISPPAGEQKARQAFYFGFIKTTTLSTLHLPSSNSRWPVQWSVTAHHFTAGKAKSSKLGYGTLQLRRTR